MIQVKRLGHATFTTPNLERQIDYWTRVIGLQIVDRGKDHCILATKLGQECIALERATEKGFLRRLAFQVKPGSDLGELEANLKKHGVKSERRKDISPGVRQAVAFVDPKGTPIDVYADYQFAPEDKGDQGISPLKFGHIAYRVNDAKKITDFYCDVLGFRVSDWMGDHFSFLRCGVDHHTVNFARYDEEKLHHIAFELRDWGAIRRVARQRKACWKCCALRPQCWAARRIKRCRTDLPLTFSRIRKRRVSFAGTATVAAQGSTRRSLAP